MKPRPPVSFKGCPRCHGTMVAEWEGHAWQYVCLMCGYRPQTEAERRASERIARAEGKREEAGR